MKVLLVHNGKGWSGGQEHLKDLATELRDRAVEVHFQVRGDTVNETRFQALGFPVRLTPFNYGWDRPPPGAEKFSVERPRRFFHGRRFPIIGLVGDSWKSRMELVEMIPSLARAFPDITFALVGNNADRALVGPIEERTRQLGIDDRVVFTGLVPRERITDVFYDMDLSVTTHRNEGFGIVHLERLAAGTPVVAYSEGGFVDIFKGEEVGVLVDGGPPEFSRAVLDLLADDEKRFAMGAAGHELVKRRYSLQAMGRTYQNFYRRLVGSPVV